MRAHSGRATDVPASGGALPTPAHSGRATDVPASGGAPMPASGGALPTPAHSGVTSPMAAPTQDARSPNVLGSWLWVLVVILMATNICTLCVLVLAFRCKREDDGSQPASGGAGPAHGGAVPADGGALPADGGAGGASTTYGGAGAAMQANAGDEVLLMYTTPQGKKLHSTRVCSKSGMHANMRGLKAWEFCAHCADSFRVHGMQKRKHE